MNPERPRVLHVVSAMGVGGVEVWLISLLKYMRAKEQSGQECEHFHILMTGGEKSQLDDAASALGATLHYIRFSRSDFIGFRREFRGLLKRERFAVVHDHQDYSGGWRLIAGAGLLPPVRIVHVHNPVMSLRVNTHSSSQKVLFQVARAAIQRLATHVLGTSTQVLREYGFTPDAFPNQIVKTLHCGFEVAAFATSHAEANASVCNEMGWPQHSKLCLFAGRLDGFDPRNPQWNHKNPEFAVDVFRAAVERGVDARMIIAGAGEHTRAKLETNVRAWGLSDRVRLVGPRQDIPRLMAASHVCLFPSLEEGLGMVAVEAQAAGMRVLASDTVPREAAAVPGMMTFMSLKDSPALWAAELERMLTLPRPEPDAAAEAVKRTDFSIDRSYGQLHAIYSQGD